MMAFKPIELASVCLPYEAVLWLSLGRLPEAFFTDDFDEARNSIRGLVEDYHLIPELHPFGATELKSNGVEIDYTRYFEAYLETPYNADVSISDDAARGTNAVGSYLADANEDEPIAIVRAVSVAMNSILERAKLKVRLALIEGRLTAYGFVVPPNWVQEDGGWHRTDDEPDGTRALEEQATISEIPSEFWANFSSVWEIGDGFTHPKGFIGAWISLRQVLELFPEPLLPISEVHCRRVGETLLDGGSAREIEKGAPRRRGRPKKSGVEVEVAVVNEFSDRAQKGELNQKREATLEDCIEWTKRILGVSISRTAAQRYLRPVFDAQK